MSLGRVVLAPPDRKELERRARSRSLAVELVRRTKVILMLAAGRSYSEISERLCCTDRYISLWKERFKQERLIGLRRRWVSVSRRLAECGANLDSNPTVRAATWPVMIRSLKRKLPTSLGCTSNHRCTLLYSASTRRAPSKRWIARTRFCPFLLAASNGMVSSTIAIGTLSSQPALDDPCARDVARTNSVGAPLPRLIPVSLSSLPHRGVEAGVGR